MARVRPALSPYIHSLDAIKLALNIVCQDEAAAVAGISEYRLGVGYKVGGCRLGGV